MVFILGYGPVTYHGPRELNQVGNDYFRLSFEFSFRIHSERKKRVHTKKYCTPVVYSHIQIKFHTHGQHDVFQKISKRVRCRFTITGG